MVWGEGLINNRFIEYKLKNNINLIAPEIPWKERQNKDYLDGLGKQISESVLQNKHQLTIYFSAPHSDFHKKNEELIVDNCKKYLIVRTSEVIGSGFGLIAMLVEGINRASKDSLVLPETIDCIDIDDLFFVVHHHLVKNKSKLKDTINLPGNCNVPTTALLSEIEKYLGKTCCLEIKYFKPDQPSITNQDHKLFLSAGIPLREDFTYSLERHFFQFKSGRKKISIVVPTYFNEKGVDEFCRRTKGFLKILEQRFEHEIIFINDGSTDKTFEKLKLIQSQDPSIKIINFSKNFGNQIAIAAGLDRASGDCVVIIDDDLQDPPEVIINFLAKWQDGYKVVYGVRPKRKGVGFCFKLIAKAYYRLLEKLSETKIPVDTGDFRLMDKVVVYNLRQMKEENLYYRGMVPWLGFSQLGWVFDRDAREFGTTTFTPYKYIKFALNGIISFSDKPLYFSSYLGFCVTVLGFVLAVYLVIVQLVSPESTIRGWTSIAAMILFFGGVQLLSIGVLGIYLSKVYREVRRRPLYVIDEAIGFDE